MWVVLALEYAARRFECSPQFFAAEPVRDRVRYETTSIARAGYLVELPNELSREE
jgi:hypothetical protein